MRGGDRRGAGVKEGASGEQYGAVGQAEAIALTRLLPRLGPEMFGR